MTDHEKWIIYAQVDIKICKPEQFNFGQMHVNTNKICVYMIHKFHCKVSNLVENVIRSF